MRTDNIFIIGANVSGESMIGYQRYYDDLVERTFVHKQKGISISGMHQFGKTSLMQQILKEAEERSEPYLPLYVDLAELKMNLAELEKEDMMTRLIEKIVWELEEKLEECGVKDDLVEKRLQEMEKISGGRYRDTFKRVISLVGKHRRLILVIDEFDSANEFSCADLELLRTLITSLTYNISIFFVSRRKLEYIVRDNYNNSHLPASVVDINICGFNEQDRMEFYDVLKTQYEITLSDGDKKCISYYAGILPSIYSRIGHQIVEKKKKGEPIDVRKICQEIMDKILSYYDLVLNRLKGDGIEKSLYAVLVGPRIGLTQYEIQKFLNIGYLSVDEEGRYFAFSEAFSEKLKQEKVEISEWENILEVDRRIKDIVRIQLRRFGIFPEDKGKYECFLEEMYGRWGSQYKPQTYNRYIESSKKEWDAELTILDVMSLKNVYLAIIQPLWEDCFRQYFNWEDYDKWERMFELCAKARDPLAHGHRECLTDSECALVNAYCETIRATLSDANTKMRIATDPIDPPRWLQERLKTKR